MGHGITAYHSDYATRARRYALIGMTEDEAIAAFGVTRRAWNQWRRVHPEFARAWDLSLKEQSGAVVGALLKRAKGFTKKGLTKFVSTPAGGKYVDYEEYFPPDVKAGLAWLAVHEPEKWGRIGAAEKPSSGGSLQLPAGAQIIIDADTLALTGLERPMKDVTPANSA